MNTDLTKEQKDYAIFLPAISGFFATFVGKQRREEYVEYSRIPTHFTNGVESMNWLEPSKSLFNYKWSLYSRSSTWISQRQSKEDMVQIEILITVGYLVTGGFQIGKGVWEGDWKDPTVKAKRNVNKFCTDGRIYGLWNDS